MEGGSLPKSTVPFAEARDLVGDDALRRAGTSKKGNATAYSNWKNGRGVPWSVVGPILKQRALPERQQSARSAPAPDGEDGALARLKTRPELLDHLRRQTEFLALIPALAEQIDALRAEVATLREQLATARAQDQAVRAMQEATEQALAARSRGRRGKTA